MDLLQKIELCRKEEKYVDSRNNEIGFCYPHGDALG